VSATNGQYRETRVADPLGRLVTSRWGLCGDGRTAVVEMAAASGLELLAAEERNPMLTSTRGTGEMIADALRHGVERVIVGIGGSATVDGGTGMAAALGVRFLDADGRPIDDCCGGRLADVRDIDLGGLDERVKEVEIVVACDVTNRLTGPEGAAHTYAPQKGADPEQTELLEEGLRNLAAVIRRALGKEVETLPGAGAAGGLGAGLVAFLGARLGSGAETVIEAVGLRERMRASSLVVTAEGSMDGQSAFGKATAAVATLARDMGIPAVGLAGSLGPGADGLYECGMSAVFSIVDSPMELSDALGRADVLLERAAESILRLWIAAEGGRQWPNAT
jgi:glycerate kinase